LSVGRFEIVDRLGHERAVYRPLLVYSWLQAFRVGYELLPRTDFGAWEEATRAWCDDLEYRLGNFAWPTDAVPAAMGDRLAELCWTALALHVAGKVFIRDAWTDLAGDIFGKLVRGTIRKRCGFTRWRFCRPPPAMRCRRRIGRWPAGF
jgi:hypothetical protein